MCEERKGTAGDSEKRYAYTSPGRLRSLGGLLEADSLLLAHRRDDSDVQFLTGIKFGLDLNAQFAFRDLHVVLLSPILSDEVEEAVVNVDELQFIFSDDRNFHVVCGRRHIFILLSCEDIDGSNVYFGVTVFASFGGRHIHDLARATSDDDVAVLAQRRALHRERERRARARRLEGLIVLFVVAHD